MLLWTSTSVGGAKRIRIRNRNLQTKITVFLYAPYASLLVHRSVAFTIKKKNFFNVGILVQSDPSQDVCRN